MKIVVATSLVALLALPAAAQINSPPAAQQALATYAKTQLVEDYLHCAAYNKIAAECSTTSNPQLAHDYEQSSAKAAESAIKLAMPIGITPADFKSRIARIDGSMRRQVAGRDGQPNCQSTALSSYYAGFCPELAADPTPRIKYWARQYELQGK